MANNAKAIFHFTRVGRISKASSTIADNAWDEFINKPRDINEPKPSDINKLIYYDVPFQITVQFFIALCISLFNNATLRIHRNIWNTVLSQYEDSPTPTFRPTTALFINLRQDLFPFPPESKQLRLQHTGNPPPTTCASSSCSITSHIHRSIWNTQVPQYEDSLTPAFCNHCIIYQFAPRSFLLSAQKAKSFVFHTGNPPPTTSANSLCSVLPTLYSGWTHLGRPILPEVKGDSRPEENVQGMPGSDVINSAKGMSTEYARREKFIL
ncbi:hypothetical protein CEXT_759781 [Caerostris extrusa]|uniref:Uncharacterized protein n=1 Tax=Caerostris extrusa TaxID=172846 RepID=A0AAV4SPD2_CAEEX|nr:hypothetical protein CEXT_759781 [Caerostris extrusa]